MKTQRKNRKFKITLYSPNGECISTIATKAYLVPVSFEFIEAMAKGNKTIKKVTVEVA